MIEFLETNVDSVKACKVRDLSYFKFGKNTIALAVDSEGSVGNRLKDEFNRPLEDVVPLMIEVISKELICMGGDPIAIYLDFTTANDAYNQKVIQIIKETIKEAGFNPDIVKATFGTYNGKVEYSCMGLSLVGAVRNDTRTGTSKSGDFVYCVGYPKLRFDLPKYTKLKTVKKILGLSYVHEVLPGGSHGIENEALQLADSNGLVFRKGNCIALNDQDKESCGAACCCLVTIDPIYKNEFESLKLPNDINLYGVLEGEKNKKVDNILGTSTQCSLEDDGTIVFGDGFKIACSSVSSYSVGNKTDDIKKIDDLGEYGRILVEKALELNDANPIAIINNVTFGMNPDGKIEIKAIRELLKTYFPNMKLDCQFTGSTEDNMKPGVTSYAIRVLGIK